MRHSWQRVRISPFQGSLQYNFLRNLTLKTGGFSAKRLFFVVTYNTSIEIECAWIGGDRMIPFHESIKEYRSQLEKGMFQQAYRGLMEYMLGLRTHFQKRFPDYEVPGGMYAGYMDMTYFALIPEFCKQRKLKIAVVFLHEQFRFEGWLSGVNRQVQAQTWKQLKDVDLNHYRLVADPVKADAVIEHVLLADPDFSSLDILTEKIEKETTRFIRDMKGLLSELA